VIIINDDKIELWQLINYYRCKHARTGVLTIHCTSLFVDMGYDEAIVKNMIMCGNCTGWHSADVAIGYSPVEARAIIKNSSKYGYVSSQ